MEAGRLETRERVERIDGARGLAIVFRLDVETNFRHAVIPRDGTADDGRRGLDRAQVARQPHGAVDILFLVDHLEPWPRRGVPRVVDLHLAGLPRPVRMDDRKYLARRRQPPARRRPAQRVEEIESDEIKVLVNRLERRDELLVDADAEVRLAHPDLDVEIAMERLLLG